MKKKIIAFDLDETLCFRTKEHNTIKRYDYCKPIKKNIIIVKKLYKSGYYIKIYTARGINSFNGNINKIYQMLYKKTYNQLIKWKIPFHELVLGKQEYDLLVDNKAININDVKSHKDILKFINAEKK